MALSLLWPGEPLKGSGRGHTWVHDLNSRLPALNLGKTLTPGATLEACLPWEVAVRMSRYCLLIIGAPKSSDTPHREGRCPAVFTVYFGWGGTSHPQLPALSWDVVTSHRVPLPCSLCSFPHYLFHHFYSIINTARLFFIETVLPKGFLIFFYLNSWKMFRQNVFFFL